MKVPFAFCHFVFTQGPPTIKPIPLYVPIPWIGDGLILTFIHKLVTIECYQNKFILFIGKLSNQALLEDLEGLKTQTWDLTRPPSSRVDLAEPDQVTLRPHNKGLGQLGLRPN